VDIKIIIPGGAVYGEADEPDISEGLVRITEGLEKIGVDPNLGYGLGGPNGYGRDYENDIFMIHKYCWCEKDECLWCGERNAPNFHYKPLELKAWWYKWIGRSMEIEGDFSTWPDVVKHCLLSLGE